MFLLSLIQCLLLFLKITKMEQKKCDLANWESSFAGVNMEDAFSNT